MRYILIVAIALTLTLPVLAVSGNELVENANMLDGQIVLFEGEVIGDIMNRGDHAWLNVNDGTRAIGIWAKKDQLNNIDRIGDYFNKGCVIKVVGVFHRACPQHGGDLDIHAEEITILDQGYPIKHPIPGWKIPLAWALFLITLGTHLIFVWLKRRSKT